MKNSNITMSEFDDFCKDVARLSEKQLKKVIDLIRLEQISLCDEQGETVHCQAELPQK